MLIFDKRVVQGYGAYR